MERACCILYFSMCAARKLKLDPPSVTRLEENYHDNVREFIYQLLLTWKRRHPEVRVRDLIKVLSESKLQKPALELKKFFSSIHCAEWSQDMVQILFFRPTVAKALKSLRLIQGQIMCCTVCCRSSYSNDMLGPCLKVQLLRGTLRWCFLVRKDGVIQKYADICQGNKQLWMSWGFHETHDTDATWQKGATVKMTLLCIDL